MTRTDLHTHEQLSLAVGNEPSGFIPTTVPQAEDYPVLQTTQTNREAVRRRIWAATIDMVVWTVFTLTSSVAFSVCLGLIPRGKLLFELAMAAMVIVKGMKTGLTIALDARKRDEDSSWNSGSDPQSSQWTNEAHRGDAHCTVDGIRTRRRKVVVSDRLNSIQQRLREWHAVLRGHVAQGHRIAKKLPAEAREFLEAETYPELVGEAADVMIVCLTDLFDHPDSTDPVGDVLAAVDEKLHINLNRTWALNPDGTVSHIRKKTRPESPG